MRIVLPISRKTCCTYHLSMNLEFVRPVLMVVGFSRIHKNIIFCIDVHSI